MPPRTIFAWLLPTGRDVTDAKASISLPGNRRFLAPAQRTKPSPHPVTDCDDEQSVAESPGHDENDYIDRLGLSFEDRPKIARALVVGWHSKCDIVLTKSKGVSRYHFAFLFDDQNRLVVRDLGSTTGTSVTYNGRCEERRVDFSWIVGGDEDVEDTTIKILVGQKIQFELAVPAFNKASTEHISNVAKFNNPERGDIKDLDSLLEANGLGNLNRQPTRRPTGMHTPSSGRLCIKQEIGRGSYGTVYRVYDVSTGEVYASKVPSDETQRELLKGLGNWRKEVDILKRLSHNRIVKFLGAEFSPSVELRFEYLPGGSLANHPTTSVFECRQICIQLLEGIVYLEEESIAHRDIKPDNILVAERTPLAILVKLTDFGLSKVTASSLMETFCGTCNYLAPEIGRKEGPYTAAVDIWSLGAVIFERLCGFPDKRVSSRQVDAWTSAILGRLKRSLRSGRLTALLGFLSDAMLVAEPCLRQPAEACLETLRGLPDGDRIRHHIPKPGSQVVVDDCCDSEAGDADSPWDVDDAAVGVVDTANSEAITVRLGHMPNEGSRDGTPKANATSIIVIDAAVNHDIFGLHLPSTGKGQPGLKRGPERDSAASAPYLPPSISTLQRPLWEILGLNELVDDPEAACNDDGGAGNIRPKRLRQK
ncbi:hypothetical protein RB597_010310 [Gaeumannomyces tritici]